MRDKIYIFLVGLNQELESRYTESYKHNYLVWDWDQFLKNNWAFDKLKKYERFLLEDHNWEVFKENNAWKLVQKDKYHYKEDKVYTFYKVDHIFEWFLKERLFDLNY